MPISSKKLKPFMSYIEESQYVKMSRLSKKTHIPMSQLMREAISIRITEGNPYTAGFNSGLEHAMKIIDNNQASQMRFPSGKSFAELINEEIEKARMNETA
jgi:hypothetical protein